MSVVLDWDESFSMQANVTSPGPQRVVLSGYVTERRPDGLYGAPLLPQLFYGADGSQLSTWRQNIPGSGEQTILSRSGGQPSIPKEELYWRRIGNSTKTPTSKAIAIPDWVMGLGLVAVGIITTFAIVMFSKPKRRRR